METAQLISAQTVKNPSERKISPHRVADQIRFSLGSDMRCRNPRDRAKPCPAYGPEQRQPHTLQNHHDRRTKTHARLDPPQHQVAANSLKRQPRSPPRSAQANAVRSLRRACIATTHHSVALPRSTGSARLIPDRPEASSGSVVRMECNRVQHTSRNGTPKTQRHATSSAVIDGR